MKKIGIPRGLHYYDYYILWQSFFNELNVDLVSSIESNKDILNLGIKSCVDEACLPVKMFHGHVEYLKDKVDYIFIPKYIRLYKNEYNCPKHLGIVDMINHSIENLPTLITPKIRVNNNRDLEITMHSIGRELKKSNSQIKNASKHAINSFDKDKRNDWIRREITPYINYKNADQDRIRLLIIGHSYDIYDNFFNMDILKKLNDKGVEIITPNDIDEKEWRLHSENKMKRIFWTEGRKVVGSAGSVIENNTVDGIIYLSAFGCGLDGVLAYLIEQNSQKKNIPFMTMTFDEQTGEAGVNTRIEAFLDMMKWRSNKIENNLSSLR